MLNDSKEKLISVYFSRILSCGKANSVWHSTTMKACFMTLFRKDNLMMRNSRQHGHWRIQCFIVEQSTRQLVSLMYFHSSLYGKCDDYKLQRKLTKLYSQNDSVPVDTRACKKKPIHALHHIHNLVLTYINPTQNDRSKFTGTRYKRVDDAHNSAIVCRHHENHVSQYHDVMTHLHLYKCFPLYMSCHRQTIFKSATIFIQRIKLIKSNVEVN